MTKDDTVVNMQKLFPTANGWKMAQDVWGDDNQEGFKNSYHRLFYKRLTAARDKSNTNPESVGISVEWYGKSCVNPTRHNVDPT